MGTAAGRSVRYGIVVLVLTALFVIWSAALTLLHRHDRNQRPVIDVCECVVLGY
jgi:hypothetical protein